MLQRTWGNFFNFYFPVGASLLVCWSFVLTVGSLLVIHWYKWKRLRWMRWLEREREREREILEGKIMVEESKNQDKFSLSPSPSSLSSSLSSDNRETSREQHVHSGDESVDVHVDVNNHGESDLTNENVNNGSVSVLNDNDNDHVVNVSSRSRSRMMMTMNGERESNNGKLGVSVWQEQEMDSMFERSDHRRRFWWRCVQRYRTACLYVFHLFLQLLPALFIPIIANQFSTVNCYNHYLIAIDELESDTTVVCRSNWTLRFLNLVSFLVFVPLFLLCTTYFFEWRPEQPHICARSHTRFDTFVYCAVFTCVFAVSFMEPLFVLVTLYEFLIVMLIVMLHIFSMVYYKKIINLMITVFTFMLMFATVIALLMATFMTLTQIYHYSQDNYPGLILFVCCFLSIISGAILTFLRYHVIGVLVNDPVALAFWTNLLQQRHLATNEIVVPRSSFEVELSTRSMSKVSNIFYKPATSERERLERWLEVDRVEEMFRNSMDSLHHSSPFVFLSFATFKIHLDPPQRERSMAGLDIDDNDGDNDDDEEEADRDPDLNPSNWATAKFMLNALSIRLQRHSTSRQVLAWLLDLRCSYYVRWKYWEDHNFEEMLRIARQRGEELARSAIEQQQATPPSAQQAQRTVDAVQSDGGAQNGIASESSIAIAVNQPNNS